MASTVFMGIPLVFNVEIIMRALHEMVARIKMVKNRLIFVEKLANSQLLAAFSATISQFFP
ncbi:MAG: hypothetical protein IE920_09995, partial [Thiotrichales bacterium]|nr:hypothetical protein [Thiotrichales bacterium]